ncbi:MAG: adenylate/guanylate cyclase domain-containing protein, partial [Pseudomonadota bacterium]
MRRSADASQPRPDAEASDRGSDGASEVADLFGGGAERRAYATVVFSDLCDSTRLGEVCEVEALARIVRGVKRIFARVISAHGGRVVQYQGDGVLAIFGYPNVDENAAQKSVSAAIELHETARRMFGDVVAGEDLEVRLHTGVHSGVVLVSDGAEEDGVYEIFGDAANTAAGLCAKAKPDEILVGGTTLDGIASLFETEPEQQITLKNRAERVRAARVGRRSDIDTRFEARRRAGVAEFIGRDRELARLDRALETAARGRLSAVCLVGDPGVGKTRLTDEFLGRVSAADSHADMLILRGYVDSLGERPPLQPIRQIARQILELDAAETQDAARAALDARLGALGGGLDQWAPVLKGLLRLEAPGAPPPSPHMIGEAFTALCAAAAGRRPVILSLDDWHWADGVSRLVLGALLRRAEEAPIMVLATARTLDVDDPFAARADE